MKYIITGHSGFVGRHFIEYLRGCEPDAEILGLDIAACGIGFGIQEREINLLDREKVDAAIAEFKPDFLLHLASFSSVAFSWKEPYDSFLNNMTILLNVLESVRKFSPACRILSIGSSEEYGIVEKEDLPLTENNPFKPASPYAVARVAQEQMSQVYVNGFKLDIVCTRSFNHIGLGQDRRFVVAGLVAKFAECACGLSAEVVVGDTGVVRDFVDVRDVVRAYYLLFKSGISGQVYNICGGQGHTIEAIIEKLKRLFNINPVIRSDANLMRPVENRVVIGAYEKIKQAVGWEPLIGIDESLSAIAAWRLHQIKEQAI
jgi:GDP-4-dehydro-6-deoxy-D-mannose reductase